MLQLCSISLVKRCATSPIMDIPELLEEAVPYKGSGESVPLLGEEVSTFQ